MVIVVNNDYDTNVEVSLDLSTLIFEYIKENNGQLTTRALVTAFEGIDGIKWGTVGDALMRLILSGRIANRDDHWGWDQWHTRHWHVIEWSDIMTETAIKKAVDDQIREEVEQINILIITAGFLSRQIGYEQENEEGEEIHESQ